MDKRFERLLFLLMGVSFVFLILSVNFNLANGKTESSENQYPGIMRFHVIANSDSKEDQALKLQVRDYVLERLQDGLSGEMVRAKESMGASFSEDKVMRQYIDNNLELVKTWAGEAIQQNNSKYTCEASVGIRHIPAKYYDDIFFPEGNYEALTITIGKGKGQNWWCVVFPPLCLVENDDSSYRSKLDMDEADKIQLKSKIMEIMEENSEQDSISNENIESASVSSILKGIYYQNLVDAFFVKKWVKTM